MVSNDIGGKWRLKPQSPLSLASIKLHHFVLHLLESTYTEYPEE